MWKDVFAWVHIYRKCVPRICLNSSEEFNAFIITNRYTVLQLLAASQSPALNVPCSSQVVSYRTRLYKSRDFYRTVFWCLDKLRDQFLSGLDPDIRNVILKGLNLVKQLIWEQGHVSLLEGYSHAVFCLSTILFVQKKIRQDLGNNRECVIIGNVFSF